MATNLEALADALPESTNARTKAAGGGLQGGEGGGGKIKHKSLKSRPGAGKRKEKLVAMEMERFKKNMALMSAGSTSTGMVVDETQMAQGSAGDEAASAVNGSSAERWAAIRGFIAQTMERKGSGEAVVGS